MAISSTAHVFVALELVDAPDLNSLTDDIQSICAFDFVDVLDRVVTLLDVVSTNAETTVYSKTLPAGTLGTDATVRLTIWGDYKYNNGGSDNVTVRVYLGGTGGTKVFECTVSTTSGANRGAEKIEVVLQAANATNAQKVHTRWSHSGSTQNNAAGTGAVPASINEAVHTTCAEDGTTALDLVVTVQPANASANHSWRRHQALLERGAT